MVLVDVEVEVWSSVWAAVDVDGVTERVQHNALSISLLHNDGTKRDHTGFLSMGNTHRPASLTRKFSS